MAKGDWRNKVMKLIGPQMVATRQLTRAMQRSNARRRRTEEKEGALDDRFERLADRVQARREAGKRQVQWPSWWKNAPTGPL